VPRREDDLGRPAQLGFHVGSKELLDHLPPERGCELAPRDLLAGAHDSQRLRRVVEVCRQRCQALVAHQHEEGDLREMARIVLIEAAGAVLDGVGAIERHRAAGFQRHPRHGLRTESLDRITIERGDRRCCWSGHAARPPRRYSASRFAFSISIMRLST
jgi:hypothetical protein